MQKRITLPAHQDAVWSYVKAQRDGNNYTLAITLVKTTMRKQYVVKSVKVLMLP